MRFEAATAAIVWITAAIGMACGAGLPLLALAVTAAHFVVVFVYPRLAAALPRSRYLEYGLRVVYEDGRGILRELLGESTSSSASRSCGSGPSSWPMRSTIGPRWR